MTHKSDSFMTCKILIEKKSMRCNSNEWLARFGNVFLYFDFAREINGILNAYFLTGNKSSDL